MNNCKLNINKCELRVKVSNVEQERLIVPNLRHTNIKQYWILNNSEQLCTIVHNCGQL